MRYSDKKMVWKLLIFFFKHMYTFKIRTLEKFLPCQIRNNSRLVIKLLFTLFHFNIFCNYYKCQKNHPSFIESTNINILHNFGLFFDQPWILLKGIHVISLLIINIKPKNVIQCTFWLWSQNIRSHFTFT